MRRCASVRDLTEAGKQNCTPQSVFAAAPRRIASPDAEIEIWHTRLDSNARQIADCEKILSPDELSRAHRYHFKRDRRRFTVARAMLRQLLGDRLGVAPSGIGFGYSRHGKPFISEPAVRTYFNIAHSEEQALFAISASRVVGVDIEGLSREIDHDAIAKRFFTRRECAQLQNYPERMRKSAFLAYWTCKEAVIKAIGDGMSLPLDKFEVAIAPGVVPRIASFFDESKNVAEWSIYELGVGNEYAAAVAAVSPYAIGCFQQETRRTRTRE